MKMFFHALLVQNFRKKILYTEIHFDIFFKLFYLKRERKERERERIFVSTNRSRYV